MNLRLKSHRVLTVFMGHVKLLSSKMFIVLTDWVRKLQVAEVRHEV